MSEETLLATFDRDDSKANQFWLLAHQQDISLLSVTLRGIPMVLYRAQHFSVRRFLRYAERRPRLLILLQSVNV